MGNPGFSLLQDADPEDTIIYGSYQSESFLRHASLAFRLATTPHVDWLNATVTNWYEVDCDDGLNYTVSNPAGICLYDLLLSYAES